MPQALGRFAVVLTTYGTLSQELPEARKPQSKQTSGDAEGYIDLVDEDDGRPSKKAKKEKKSDKGGPLYRVSWHRVVLDEAQVIKNPRTMAAHAVWALRAGRRWCLSGTPLQNAVDDLYAYFRFLRYSPYNKYQAFKELIRDPIMGQNPDVGFRRLQAVLQIILLRRTKTSKIDGQPVITLPERKVTLVQKEFSQEEREFYVKLEKDAAARMKRLASEGAGQTYVNMLWMLLRMRQACNHPRLVRGDTKQSSRREKEAAAEAAAARKLPAALRTSLAATLRDGLTECAECGDVPEEPVVSVCGHIFCRQCVSTAVSSAGQDTAEAELAFHCPTCSRTLGKNDTFGEGALHVHSGGDQGASSYGADKDWASSTKLEALMGVLQNLRAEGEAAAAEDDQPMVRSLSQAQLGQALGRGRGSNGRLSAPPSNALYSEKVIVFSQWTSMLDLIEARLKKEK